VDKQRIQLPPPTMAIQFEDGTRMLVPQPARNIWFRLDDAYVLNNTIPELPAHTAVLEWAGNSPNSNAPQRTDPLWAVVCLRTGLAILVAVAAFLLILGAFLFTLAFA
jgi:hypothetical protein